MCEKLYYVSLDYATFGVVTHNNIVCRSTAPIAKWAIGKPINYVLNYYKKKGARIEVMEA